MYQRKPNDRDPTGVREIAIEMPLAMAQGPEGQAVTKVMMQPVLYKVLLVDLNIW